MDKITDPKEFLSLADLERGYKARYEAAPVTAAARAELLQDMHKLLQADPRMLLVDALDKAGDNVWPADDHCICRYDLRNDVGARLARHAGALRKEGRKSTPLAIVERALSPPALPVARPVNAMMDTAS